MLISVKFVGSLDVTLEGKHTSNHSMKSGKYGHHHHLFCKRFGIQASCFHTVLFHWLNSMVILENLACPASICTSASQVRLVIWHPASAFVPAFPFASPVSPVSLVQLTGKFHGTLDFPSQPGIRHTASQECLILHFGHLYSRRMHGIHGIPTSVRAKFPGWSLNACSNTCAENGSKVGRCAEG